jgi:small subunit ribosomal protein S6
MTKKYELLYVLPAKYTEAEISQLSEKIKETVTSIGGAVSEVHHLGKRKLAYPINHVRHGNYVLAFFEADAAVLAKLNETLRLSADLLRHLIVERDPYLTQIPSLAETAEMRSEDDAPRERRPEPPRGRPTAAQKPISMEDLDKKLDEILTEEVL